jgi:hypothetical protein
MRLTTKQAKARGLKIPNPPAKAPKYGNKKITVNGVKFDSKAEYECYLAVCYHFSDSPLQRGFRVDRNTKNVKLTAGIAMRPDFSVGIVGQAPRYYHEFKGFETDTYKLKKKLWKQYGPCPLVIWKGTGKNLKIVETITGAIAPLNLGEK